MSNPGPSEESVGVETTSGEESGSSSVDSRPLIISSHELLQGRRELWIEHRGEMYRLRLTSAGKLYMTK